MADRPDTKVRPMALSMYCEAQLALIVNALRRRVHVHRGVHEARKGMRRLRSAIALGAKQLGPAAANADAALRRLCRGLSKLRDAQVALETARLKFAASARGEQVELWRRMTLRLAAARSRAMRQARARDKEFLKRRSAIERIAENISALRWSRVDAEILRAQLRRSAERAGQAADHYLAEPGLLALHRLRRRLRRYRMQIEALSAGDHATSEVARDELGRLVGRHMDVLGRLSKRVDQIGELLDAHLLRMAIRRLPAHPDRTAALGLLRKESGRISARKPAPRRLPATSRRVRNAPSHIEAVGGQMPQAQGQMKKSSADEKGRGK